MENFQAGKCGQFLEKNYFRRGGVMHLFLPGEQRQKGPGKD
jgi:hypothetical protein